MNRSRTVCAVPSSLAALRRTKEFPPFVIWRGSLRLIQTQYKKLIRELETEGYIYSVPGKGSFVGECLEAREARKLELYGQLDLTVTELKHLGVTTVDVCSHITSL